MSPISSQDTSTNNETYTPPRLPGFLTDAHNLKPIVGVPADEEVKAIHAAIRAVNGILNVPSLYDPDLPIQLAQHLFNVQMAVYRSTYPFGIFPGNATYTPPSLPSHIPVTLEPVVGAPSDEQLKVAQNAVRAIEYLANTPVIFDPDLSMSMSQHLFNLQIARYILQSTQGQFTSKPSQSHSTLAGDDMHPSSSVASESRPIIEPRSDIQHEEDLGTPEEEGAVQTEEMGQARPLRLEQGNPQDETNRLLSEVGEVLRNTNRVLISTQQSLIRVQSGGSFALVNQKGELPSSHGLPKLHGSSWNQLSDQIIANYLKFYDIGAEFLEAGEISKLKPNQRDAAQQALYHYVIKDA